MKYRLINNAGEGQVGRLGSMMIYVIPKDGDEPIKIVLRMGKRMIRYILLMSTRAPKKLEKHLEHYMKD